MKAPHQAVRGHSKFAAAAQPVLTLRNGDAAWTHDSDNGEADDRGPARAVVRAVVFGLAGWLVFIALIRILVL